MTAMDASWGYLKGFDYKENHGAKPEPVTPERLLAIAQYLKTHTKIDTRKYFNTSFATIDRAKKAFPDEWQ